MSAITVVLDDRTAADLQTLSDGCHATPSEYAARLLRRAVRAMRPRPVFDLAAVAAASREFAAEDLAIAESDSAYSAELLATEDRA